MTPTATHPSMCRPRLHTERVMGMVVSIDVRDPIPSTAIDEVVGWLHHVDATFSVHRPDSTVSRFARREIQPTDLDPDVIEVLLACEDWCVSTAGAFDITAVPTPTGTRLDPSGYVKGWAVERAAAILERHGAHNFAINAGGDVTLRGRPEHGRSWRVGIRHPGAGDEMVRVLHLHDRAAVATSGSYERGAHIIDPASGSPTADLASVTVWGTDLAVADAAATAVYVMGIDGLAWIAHHLPGYEGLIVTHQGHTLATEGFDRSQP